MTYLPNQLNVYDTYTYNLSLYMIRPDRVGFLDTNIRDGNSRLIADNARKARYNISDMEQSFVTGHNKVRSTFGHRFSMTIAEANGVTLLDFIRQQARDLGIDNHQQAVYIIRIEFNGRLPSGVARKHPQVFYYPVTIRDMQIKVDQGGGMYFINAVENSTNAYSYLNNVIREQITILATTVGDFFEQFNREANQSMKDAIVYSTDQLFADTFGIEFDANISSWKQWEFQALTEEETQNGINIISAPEGGSRQLQITVQNGTNLTDLVNVILGLTTEYKNILLNGNGSREFGRQKPNEDVTSKLDQLPIFHKVIANLEYGQYDFVRGDYVKNISYKVVPYIISDEVISPRAYLDSITDSGIQARRVQNMRDSQLLRKRYDYIYTGKNTEVLEFDIKFDHAYYYVTPYGGGQFGYANQTTPIQSQAPDSPLGRLLDQVVADREQIANLEQQRSQAQTRLAGGLRSALGTLENIGIQIQVTTNRFQDNANQFYSELQNSGLSPNEIAANLRFATDVINDDDIASSDNDNRGGLLKFGALQTNIDNPSDLVQIELGIRGDPYWLGRPNSFYESNLQDSDDLADFERGTINFFLNFNVPVADEDSTGRRKPREENAISGLYTVRDVISRYRDGQFTMYLNAVRDLGTNTPTAANSLESDGGSITDGGNSIRQSGIDIAQRIEDAGRGILRGF